MLILNCINYLFLLLILSKLVLFLTLNVIMFKYEQEN